MNKRPHKSNVKQIVLTVFSVVFIFLIFVQSPTTNKSSRADVSGLSTAIATDAATVYIPSFTASPTRTGVIATASATIFIPSHTATSTVTTSWSVTPSNTATPTPTTSGSSLYLSKRVENITRPGAVVYYNPAKPLDELVYYLVVVNTSSVVIPSYVFQDDIRDILEYADVIAADPENPIVNNGIISWSAVPLYPNITVTKSFRVKVRYPLSQPTIADRLMTNVFGNLVTVYVSDDGSVITPTITDTATPIIPPKTKTPTRTPTKTPTKTKTPTRTSTPYPTNTPSQTPIDVDETNTPRPTKTPTHSLRTRTGDVAGLMFPTFVGSMLCLLGVGRLVIKKKKRK